MRQRWVTLRSFSKGGLASAGFARCKLGGATGSARGAPLFNYFDSDVQVGGLMSRAQSPYCHAIREQRLF